MRRLMVLALIFAGIVSPAITLAQSHDQARNPCGYRAHMWPKVQAVAAFVAQASTLTSDRAAGRGTVVLDGVFDVATDYGAGIRLNKPLVHALIAAVSDAETKSVAAANRALATAWAMLKSVPSKCGTATKPKKATPPPAPKPGPTPTIADLLDQKGTGDQTTAIFHAPHDWSISYFFDCSTFGQSGNFVIEVFDANNNLVNVAANKISSGDIGDFDEHRGGDFYLEILSECDWGVTAWPL